MDPANSSRYVANMIFAVIGQAISDGVITIQDRNLWDTYIGWWRALYIRSFDEVKITNNTGKKITSAIGYLYGNELWYRSGNTEAEKKWLVPLAKRWCPFQHVSDTGRVTDNGDAYIQFNLNVTGSDEIFGTVMAQNDNGESSKVYVDGKEIVSQVDCCCTLAQIELQNGNHVIKLFGHKTWSNISPRAAFVMIGGNVSNTTASISPYPYGDPHPMITEFPEGESIIENEEN